MLSGGIGSSICVSVSSSAVSSSSRHATALRASSTPPSATKRCPGRSSAPHASESLPSRMRRPLGVSSSANSVGNLFMSPPLLSPALARQLHQRRADLSQRQHPAHRAGGHRLLGHSVDDGRLLGLGPHLA